jgi:hypothetical protein
LSPKRLQMPVMAAGPKWESRMNANHRHRQRMRSASISLLRSAHENIP